MDTLTELEDEVTVEAFDLWLKHARPGSKLEYHRGNLALDREKVTTLPNYGGLVAHVFYEPLHSVGHAAWRAYELGQVELVQKKIGREVYSYFAFKRRGQKPKITRRYQ